MTTHRACHCCGLIHTVPALHPDQTAICVRCGTPFANTQNGEQAARRTAAAALAAFVLFWPAILLPILEIERLGHHHETSVLTGIVQLLQRGNLFVGVVVLVFSIVFPLLKILMLLELSLTGLLHRRHKALTYRIMEHAGKWSMMDVMLLAFLVMLVKLGGLVEFQFGPAVFAFVLCVGLSTLASICFDPHQIWEQASE